MDLEYDSTGRKVRARNDAGEPICGRKKRTGGICQVQIGLNRDGLCTKHKNKPGFLKAPLSEQEACFAAYYAACFNAERAARLSGYPQQALDSQGGRLLAKPAIREEIKRVQLENARSLTMDTGSMLRQLERMITFDARNLFDGRGAPLGPHELDDDTAAAITAVDLIGTRSSGPLWKCRFGGRLAALQTALMVRGALDPNCDMGALTDEEVLEYERIQVKLTARSRRGRG